MAQSLTPEEAHELRQVILGRGLDLASAELELNPTTLLRAAVGLPLHNATRLVIQQRLAAKAGAA